jgi:hypothetical protein
MGDTYNLPEVPKPPGGYLEAIWQEVEETAVFAGLDPAKFNDSHREILAHIVGFLQQSNATHNPTSAKSDNLRQKLGRWLSPQTSKIDDAPAPPAPIIICGKPGTGKTTFLNVLDIVLRRIFDLPDNIQPLMQKGDYQYTVTKRSVCGLPISLLSVKKWAGLLHFYTWNRDQHGLVPADRAKFIQNSLLPMRLIFADEVEMTGYAPTIPNLAQHGLLIIGTSNQHRFAQLEEQQVSPHVYTFGGVDLRAGSPADAVVLPEDAAWALFDQLKLEPTMQFERLVYHQRQQDGILFVWLDFATAVHAPLLENEWANFFHSLPHDATMPLILLLDDFSLDVLRVDYNAIIRFVSLFDLIEQQGIGVLVRNQNSAAELSGEALAHMKITIHAARGVPEEIKVKTAVGIDRATSRIGQAGHKAKAVLRL